MKCPYLILAIIFVIIVIIGVVSVMNFEKSEGNNQGYSNDTSNGTVNETNGSNLNIITIKDNSFTPNDVQVKTGTYVQWVNNDEKQHQILGNDGIFRSSVLYTGETYTFCFTQPGVYVYHCVIHPNEMGRIIVHT